MRLIDYVRWLFVLSAVVACAGGQKKIFISQPDMQHASNAAFEVKIRPLKLNNPYYVAFELILRNKSSKPLSIDWNKTRYVHNDVDQGRFAFEGISAEEVKSGISPEWVASGETLSKTIAPMKTIGFLRGNDVPGQGQSNFFAGILPDGRNSVALMITQGDRQWTETLTFRLVTQQLPK